MFKSWKGEIDKIIMYKRVNVHGYKKLYVFTIHVVLYCIKNIHILYTFYVHPFLCSYFPVRLL